MTDCPPADVVVRGIDRVAIAEPEFDHHTVDISDARRLGTHGAERVQVDRFLLLGSERSELNENGALRRRIGTPSRVTISLCGERPEPVGLTCIRSAYCPVAVRRSGEDGTGSMVVCLTSSSTTRCSGGLASRSFMSRCCSTSTRAACQADQ